MGLFRKRSAGHEDRSLFGWWISGEGSLPTGYHRLLDSPEIMAVVDSIAAPISSTTIYLMRNTSHGDKRERTRLSRFVDVTPWRHGTRQDWLNWIVTTLLTEGDGNAWVLPHYHGGTGWLTDLEPMPGAALVPEADRVGYSVAWRGGEYPEDAVLHFRLFTDPSDPFRGRGYRISAGALAASIKQTSELKALLSSPDYKPPMIVAVNSEADLADDDKREEFRRRYLEDNDRGKPWILPADLVKVEQVRPFSLTDLAIRDNLELDRAAVASLFRVPAFLVGVGKFDRHEYNNFVRRVLRPICTNLAQELTRCLLSSEDLYFAFNERRLYSYDTADLVGMGLAMSDRGFMNGDEVRDLAMMDPAGLREYRALENYIPFDMAAFQKKLTGGDSDA